MKPEAKERKQIPIEVQTVIVHKPDDKTPFPSRTTDVTDVNVLYRRVNPDMRKSEERQIAEAADILVPLLLSQDALNKQMQPYKGVIEGLTSSIEGLRGVTRINEDGSGYRLPVSIPETIEYQREGLDSSLGKFYDEVVTRTEAVITSTVPKGVRPELFLGAMAIVLDSLGVPKEDLPKYLSMVIKLYIDEGKIQELIANKSIILPEGTRTVTPGKPKILKPSIFTKNESQAQLDLGQEEIEETEED